jgi:hypothetical protein
MPRSERTSAQYEPNPSLRRIMGEAVVVVAALAATVVLAQPSDLAAGAQALQHGDSVEAARLFSRALDAQRLSPDERERAYLGRARAFLAAGDAADALDDARSALVINPDDDAAAGVRQKAQIALIARRPPEQDPSHAAAAVGLNARARTLYPQNDLATKAHEASLAHFHEDLSRYQAERQADQDRYAAAQADYQAKLKAAEEKRQADLAAWNARVAACKKGDRSQCAVR